MLRKFNLLFFSHRDKLTISFLPLKGTYASKLYFFLFLNISRRNRKLFLFESSKVFCSKVHLCISFHDSYLKKLSFTKKRRNFRFEVRKLVFNPFRLTFGLPKIVWGEGPRVPSPLFPYCDSNLLHLINFWKALSLYFNNLQKTESFQNFKYLLQYQVIKLKMCKQKNCAKYDQKVIHFLKSS